MAGAPAVLYMNRARSGPLHDKPNVRVGGWAGDHGRGVSWPALPSQGWLAPRCVCSLASLALAPQPQLSPILTPSESQHPPLPHCRPICPAGPPGLQPLGRQYHGSAAAANQPAARAGGRLVGHAAVPGAAPPWVLLCIGYGGAACMEAMCSSTQLSLTICALPADSFDSSVLHFPIDSPTF